MWNWRSIASVFAVALLSSLLTVVIYHQLDLGRPIVIQEDQQPRAVEVRHIYTQVPSVGAEADFVAASTSAASSVAFIRAVQMNKNRFWGQKEYSYNSGSGVLVSADGYILSNLHVIENAKEIHITLDDQREYQAEIIGQDKNTDLALLKIEANGLTHFTFGDSDSVQVGQWVLAVGNPFKLQSTVTAGIVSAKARNIDLKDSYTAIESFIQTDAAVNSGNSGGALVNTKGELIGINTAIISYSGQYEGYSFAIPSNVVRKIYDDLRDHGAAQRGWLDVNVSSVNQERATSLGLDEIRGVYIDNAFADGAADRAGLRPGDVIQVIDGREIIAIPDFMEYLAQKRPDDILHIKYYRRGDYRSTQVTLQRRQAKTMTNPSEEAMPLLAELGIQVRNLQAAEENRMEIYGVKISSIKQESQADWANMEPGYIITHIENVPVRTVNEFLSELNNVRGNFILKGQYPNHDGEWLYELNLHQ